MGDSQQEISDPMLLRAKTACQTVLGLASLNTGESFFDLGGDSLAAVELASLLEDLLGIPVEFEDIIFSDSLLDAVVALVARRSGSSR